MQKLANDGDLNATHAGAPLEVLHLAAFAEYLGNTLFVMEPQWTSMHAGMPSTSQCMQ